jgi:hypothetical protein
MLPATFRHLLYLPLGATGMQPTVPIEHANALIKWVCPSGGRSKEHRRCTCSDQTVKSSQVAQGVQVLVNPKDLALNYLDASGRFTGMPCQGPWPIGPIVQTQHTIIEKLGE